MGILEMPLRPGALSFAASDLIFGIFGNTDNFAA